MKKQPRKFKVSDIDPETNEVKSSQSKREMFMIPGINSVSPYVKAQQKGKVALGEHYSKMKNYIGNNQPGPLNTSLTDPISISKLTANNSQNFSITPKATSKYKEINQHQICSIQLEKSNSKNPSHPLPTLYHPSTQPPSHRDPPAHLARSNILASQGTSILNIGHPTNTHHNPGVVGNKSMTEYLYRKQQNIGGTSTAKNSYNL
mmetsp:Transcript_12397/g.12439  ORF Transcript_12397/g.12439 Transcript_12397/m.12439 type:complete len:205 (+) Transcript_12397:1176-1790(+)